ncbi:hypothetical protein IE81DRAFT_320046 [Ceraceosorus guamensis]|uniref:Uncharacterized protein n=1 Tax=Ceraceosorus guamensis TaxID=1522189 RepID=A0A316WEB0_9BASI|nr:hypothetical protein IE81DRAFT_320046 [Ceraceosorus guamensis]PWN45745.1 hypothetical protein IE81DRAFT_320046 [Ceraceosorus guamensis]
MSAQEQHPHGSRAGLVNARLSDEDLISVIAGLVMPSTPDSTQPERLPKRRKLSRMWSPLQEKHFNSAHSTGQTMNAKQGNASEVTSRLAVDMQRLSTTWCAEPKERRQEPTLRKRISGGLLKSPRLGVREHSEPARESVCRSSSSQWLLVDKDGAFSNVPDHLSSTSQERCGAKDEKEWCIIDASEFGPSEQRRSKRQTSTRSTPLVVPTVMLTSSSHDSLSEEKTCDALDTSRWYMSNYNPLSDLLHPSEATSPHPRTYTREIARVPRNAQAWAESNSSKHDEPRLADFGDGEVFLLGTQHPQRAQRSSAREDDGKPRRRRGSKRRAAEGEVTLSGSTGKPALASLASASREKVRIEGSGRGNAGQDSSKLENEHEQAKLQATLSERGRRRRHYATDRTVLRKLNDERAILGIGRPGMSKADESHNRGDGSALLTTEQARPVNEDHVSSPQALEHEATSGRERQLEPASSMVPIRESSLPSGPPSSDGAA